MPGASPKTPASRASVPMHPHGAGRRRDRHGHLHLGRPSEGQIQARRQLGPVASAWASCSGAPCRCWPIGSRRECSPGQVVLLENCRLNVGEKNDRALARKLAAAVRHLCARRLWHRAPRRGQHVWHCPVCPIACAGRLLAARSTPLPGPASAPAPAAGHRGRLKVSANSPYCSRWRAKWTSSSWAGALPTPSCWRRACP